MLDSIKIYVNGKDIVVRKGITLLELSKMYEHEYLHKILIAKVDGKYQELNDAITKLCHIEFLDLTDEVANRVYLNGLVYLANYCYKELYGSNGVLSTKFSADKGLYIESKNKLTREMLFELERKMLEIIKSNIKIHKVTISREDAINYFKETGDIKKAGLLEYMTNTYVNLYRMGNQYDYMFSLMPSETSCLNEFKLTYLDETGFILRYPTIYSNGTIPKYKHHHQMFEIYKNSKHWGKLMNLETSVDVNNAIRDGKMPDLIKITETLYSHRLLEVAEKIGEDKRIKIVLIAGPSSSGKTTTTRKLAMSLKAFGLNPKMISMDNFFVERVDTPKDENGNYNFECIEAVDLDLFNKTMDQLLKGQEVTMPTFNFITGKKEYKNKMKLEKDDIILIEGIHCLNPIILNNIDSNKKYKIYLSALTEINIDEDNRIPTTDNRLIRRLVRDYYTRGYLPNQALEGWASVRRGEEEYIFPYQDEANFTINTGLIYEFPILKVFALPLLYTVKKEEPCYEMAKRLIRLLDVFLPVSSEYVPNDSIIREFIGGSYFDK